MYAGQMVEGGPSDDGHPAAQAPLHATAAFRLRLTPTDPRQATPLACARRDSQPDYPADRLPLSSALPPCHARLPRALPRSH